VTVSRRVALFIPGDSDCLRYFSALDGGVAGVGKIARSSLGACASTRRERWLGVYRLPVFAVRLYRVLILL
jgi:hypothetical protein